MAMKERGRSRGHEIEIEIADDGTPSVRVDGESVPVRIIDGGYAVTFHEPDADLMTAVKRYVRGLPQV